MTYACEILAVLGLSGEHLLSLLIGDLRDLPVHNAVVTNPVND